MSVSPASAVGDETEGLEALNVTVEHHRREAEQNLAQAEQVPMKSADALASIAAAHATLALLAHLQTLRPGKPC